MSRTTPTDKVFPYRRDADGRSLCRVCGRQCPPRRRTTCGPDCAEEIRQYAYWDHMRDVVWRRDRGVCRQCGTDIAWLMIATDSLRSVWQPGHSGRVDGLLRRESNVWTKFRDRLRGGGRSWWECDHIVPLSEGGRHHRDNLRVLCVPCHRRETAALASRRAGRHTLFAEVSA